MQLRELRIKGFKSFANETIIHFSKDVTGIVGPNGSGKSNIVDAIRWVLGEQKTTDLRLDKMQDVIFNGTRKKPAGKEASVTLTFKNTSHTPGIDYSYVTISRHLFRNGDSEYRLNKVPCRLKDIRHLFRDTGIGSDSYAIIELSMIDDILQDKNRSRMKMFEEAAGISKFKERKRETFNKLQLAENDLERLEDILVEIKTNLNALEKQSRRARRYKKIKEEYRELRFREAAAKSAEFQGMIGKIKERSDLLADEASQLNGKINQKNSEVEDLHSGIITEEESLNSEKADYNNFISEIQNTEYNIQLLNQKLQNALDTHRELEKEIGRSNDYMKVLEEEVLKLKKEAVEMEERLTFMQEETDSAGKIFRDEKEMTGEAAAHLRKLESETEKIRTQLTETEKELIQKEGKSENILREISRLEYELNHTEKQYRSTGEEVKNLEAKYNEEDETLQQIKEEDRRRIAELEQVREKREKLKEERIHLQGRIDNTISRVSFLREVIARLEGSPESVKYLIREKSIDAALLADIMEIDESFRPALEMYLKDNLDAIVLKDRREAVEYIDLLRKEKKGFSQFFILSELKKVENQLPAPINSFPVLDVLQFKKGYELLEALFTNVFFTTDAAETDSIPAGAVLIDIKGLAIHTRGRAAGGSRPSYDVSKIGRKQQLEKLESTLEDLRTSLGKNEIELEKAEQKASGLKHNRSSEYLRRQDELVKELNMRLQVKKHQLNDLSGQREDIKKRIPGLQDEKDHLTGIISSLKEKKEEVQNELSEKTTELSNLQKKQDILSDKTESLKEAWQSLHIKNINLKHELENNQRKGDHKTERLEELEEEIRNNIKKLKENEKLQNSLRERIETEKEAQAEAIASKESRQKLLREAERIYFGKKEVILEKEKEVRELQNRLSAKKEKIRELEFERQRLKDRIEETVNMVKVEFSLESVENMEGEELTDDEKKRIVRLRERIQNYGPVNPIAEEEYEKMNERHEHLVTQRDDIREARATLEKTIAEIERTATFRFIEAFEKVRENFIHVFRTLFSEEDSCDLLLTDEDNPLESNIDIIAKPKGKKPKSLSQLSGGEKTLTATALLFALYLLKPAPFCIFDEVDAPLDDPNIHKFNNIIRRFSEKSQFIIVTHNKQTMASVDVIYGVYMDEPGISGVSAVDFTYLEDVSELVVA